ncbi:PH domain-containing protein [Flavobacterium saccharophilum]|uniref:PH domain-containing protein n=1 Tax=Flavobacterium saccharophilum TaxID=29534 RepID=A0A1M7M3X8_9FLAO|nr:PH domain-containing protein [Flavobacterium saccharophilum]SHM85377.1 PH domain-containing protein [Flavobacterium saccharophilum]
MATFKSKISIGLVLFLAVVLGGMFIKLLYDGSWSVSLLIFCQILFIAHMFSTTFYTIENEKLHIKSGFLVNISIEIQQIKKISETNTIMSAPAVSFDRLEILYNKFDTVVISPKEKVQFIEAIKKINPQVEVKLKNKTLVT